MMEIDCVGWTVTMHCSQVGRNRLVTKEIRVNDPDITLAAAGNVRPPPSIDEERLRGLDNYNALFSSQKNSFGDKEIRVNDLDITLAAAGNVRQTHPLMRKGCVGWIITMHCSQVRRSRMVTKSGKRITLQRCHVGVT